METTSLDNVTREHASARPGSHRAAVEAAAAFTVFGRSKWAGVCLFLGILATGADLAIHNGLLSGIPNELLAGSLPGSALMRAGTVLFSAALILLAVPAAGLTKTQEEHDQ